ncbi:MULTISPECIES: hypothetical protein [Limnospira]|uniref:Uncharacterized protein n=1 Tax=Limnospira fusiformis PMC 851.14 TaxID=2219512 RepID=A0ABU9ESP8_LIMFS|nr:MULTISPECIES: hypothetical protein [unclassified Limnospira]MDY7051588.1 hypothetical protein [Limnospira fusiformis LS22]QJB28408.1 hypothetical protein HFV01_24695 [Limnospira fusiformis SAG 85.79]RAQ45714.1 hypothetical protein B9S53_07360 [Arthrospira sp. O9.13F]MDT9190173.1 hypothetical protein [Limnospira sp. PMC 894.15]MDT9236107.1 hypothetical protein [Limnospira sp. PMC 917.15]
MKTLVHKIVATTVSISLLLPTASAWGRPPALRWSFRSHQMSIDGCLDKAARVMRQEGLRNVRRNREGRYVSGLLDNYAIDIRCGSQEWVVIATGYDNDGTALWRNRLREAMER